VQFERHLAAEERLLAAAGRAAMAPGIIRALADATSLHPSVTVLLALPLAGAGAAAARTALRYVVTFR
jgi:hypothetical protein